MSSWGLGNTIFEITLGTWVFKYLVPKVVFFFRIASGVLKTHQFFWKFQIFKFTVRVLGILAFKFILPLKHLRYPSGVQRRIYKTSAKRESRWVIHKFDYQRNISNHVGSGLGWSWAPYFHKAQNSGIFKNMRIFFSLS